MRENRVPCLHSPHQSTPPKQGSLAIEQTCLRLSGRAASLLAFRGASRPPSIPLRTYQPRQPSSAQPTMSNPHTHTHTLSLSLLSVRCKKEEREKEGGTGCQHRQYKNRGIHPITGGPGITHPPRIRMLSESASIRRKKGIVFCGKKMMDVLLLLLLSVR